ncbi:MAG: WYL domain-containing protein [Clostridia bacterium]|nr:WYL domain-containing protein [Clostridia bacterium]
MSTLVLIEKLAECGIEVDRKILYSDVKMLNDFGYEVMCRRSSSNEYYVADRKFDIPEIHILMDAVRAAGFITEKKTVDLVNRIAQLAGSKRAEVLTRNIVEFNTAKSRNENIYYSVYEITSAIEEKKKIAFSYFDYDTKRNKVYRKDKTDTSKNKQYVVNPLATVFSNDNYYLICYDDKHGNLAHYRVDRMDDVIMLDIPITETKQSKSFDLVKHKQQLFGMYGGETQQVSFEADKDLIDVVFDFFKANLHITETSGNKILFTADVQVSKPFIAWCCSFGTQLKVISPQTVVGTVKDYLADTLGQY